MPKNPHAVALGKLGGLKGGIARAKKLSKKRRKEIAIKAAETRWRSEKVAKVCNLCRRPCTETKEGVSCEHCGWGPKKTNDFTSSETKAFGEGF